jgi:hypothetical protein
MKTLLSLILISLAFNSAGCAGPVTGAAAPSYFIDVHEFGPGGVTAAAVADAHKKDLAVQEKHGVRFLEYWVDEQHGLVYCLSEARGAAAITATHREAHGLLPATILSVAGGTAVQPSQGKQLFLDIHNLGAGNVTAAAVAEAHQKDLAVEGQFGVHFLNYWVDELGGKVLCLSEAPGAGDVRETHRKAHGLLPETIVPVTRAQ